MRKSALAKKETFPLVVLYNGVVSNPSQIKENDLVDIDTLSELHQSANYLCLVKNVDHKKRRLFGKFIDIDHGYEKEFEDGILLDDLKQITVQAENAYLLFRSIEKIIDISGR